MGVCENVIFFLEVLEIQSLNIFPSESKSMLVSNHSNSWNIHSLTFIT